MSSTDNAANTAPPACPLVIVPSPSDLHEVQSLIPSNSESQDVVEVSFSQKPMTAICPALKNAWTKQAADEAEQGGEATMPSGWMMVPGSSISHSSRNLRLGCHILTILRPQDVIVCGPREESKLRDFAEFLQCVLAGAPDPDAAFAIIPGLDHVESRTTIIQKMVETFVRKFLTKHDESTEENSSSDDASTEVVAVPTHSLPTLTLSLSAFKVPIVGESAAWMSKFSDHKVIFSHIKSDQVVPALISQAKNLPDVEEALVSGFVCNNPRQVGIAYRLVGEETDGHVVSVNCSTGTEIHIKSPSELKWMQWREWPLVIRAHVEEVSVGRLVVHCIDGKTMAPIQAIMLHDNRIGWQPCEDTDVAPRALKISEDILGLVNAKGPCAFTFAVTRAGPKLVNSFFGRITKGHLSLVFMSKYFPHLLKNNQKLVGNGTAGGAEKKPKKTGVKWSIWHFVPSADATVWGLWQTLLLGGCALVPRTGKKPNFGCFPITFVPEVSCSVLCVGPDEAKIATLREFVSSYLHYIFSPDDPLHQTQLPPSPNVSLTVPQWKKTSPPKAAPKAAEETDSSRDSTGSASSSATSTGASAGAEMAADLPPPCPRVWCYNTTTAAMSRTGSLEDSTLVLPLMSKVDYVILPQSTNVEQFANFAVPLLGLSMEHVIWCDVQHWWTLPVTTSGSSHSAASGGAGHTTSTSNTSSYNRPSGGGGSADGSGGGGEGGGSSSVVGPNTNTSSASLPSFSILDDPNVSSTLLKLATTRYSDLKPLDTNLVFMFHDGRSLLHGPMIDTLAKYKCVLHREKHVFRPITMHAVAETLQQQEAEMAASISAGDSNDVTPTGSTSSSSSGVPTRNVGPALVAPTYTCTTSDDFEAALAFFKAQLAESSELIGEDCCALVASSGEGMVYPLGPIGAMVARPSDGAMLITYPCVLSLVPQADYSSAGLSLLFSIVRLGGTLLEHPLLRVLIDDMEQSYHSFDFAKLPAEEGEKWTKMMLEAAREALSSLTIRRNGVVDFVVCRGRLWITEGSGNLLSEALVTCANICAVRQPTVYQVPGEKPSPDCLRGHWKVVRITTPQTCDVWQVWDFLVSKKLAYEPQGTNRGSGIFPLSFSSGSLSTVLCLGRTEERVEKLVAHLTDFVATYAQPAASLTKVMSVFRKGDFTKSSIPRIWSFVRESSAMFTECKINCAAAFIRPEPQDIVLLEDTVESNEFWHFCCSAYGLLQTQAVFVDTLQTVEDSTAATVEKVVERLGGVNRVMFIPGVADEISLQWASELEKRLTEKSITLRLFGETREEVMQHSFSGFFRNAEEPEKPPQYQEQAARLGIKVRDSVYCDSFDGLRLAWDQLKPSQGIIIRPVRYLNGPIIHVRARTQLNFCTLDVSEGYLIDSCTMDQWESSKMYIVLTVARDIVGAPLEVIHLAGRGVAFGTALEPTPLIQKLMEKTNKALKEFKLEGPGSFVWRSVDNDTDIELVNSNMSQFELFHSAVLFQERFALTNQSIFAFTQCVPGNIDIWNVWNQLVDKEFALLPETSTVGIFPLSYVKGSDCLFLGVGDSIEKAQELQQSLVLSVLPACASTIKAGVKESITSFHNVDTRRIWLQGPRPEYKRESQRMNLTMRCMCLVRPGIDFVIVPGEYPALREYAVFLKKVLKLEEGQVIFTKGTHFNMDSEILADDDIQSNLHCIMASDPKGPSNFVFVPYAVTENFLAWAKPFLALGVGVVGEDEEWILKYGHKGILHRHIRTPDEPSVIEKLGAGKIAVCKGFTCDTPEDAVAAWKEMDVEEAVIKPVLGAAGEGIMFVDSEEKLALYTFPYGQICLEEKLDLDCSDDGIILAPATHYLENEVYLAPCDQLMVNFGYAGWRPSLCKPKVVEACARMVGRILPRIDPHGPGGFDFLISKDHSYLSDVNTGRFNGAHFPKVFFSNWCKSLDQPWMCFKSVPPPLMTIEKFWARLCKIKIQFEPGKSERGVFPMIFYPGRSGQIVVIGKDESDLDILKERTTSIMSSSAAPKEETEAVLDANMLSTFISTDFTPTMPAVIDIPPPPVTPLASPRAIANIGGGSGGMADDAAPLERRALRLSGLTVIHNAAGVYSPKCLGAGCHGVVLGGEKIMAFLDDCVDPESIIANAARVIDAQDCFIVPGFVDMHMHLIGGGGEMGPQSRVPEAKLSEIVDAGVTTAVGVLGTDGVTRSPETLHAKVRALNLDGISAYMYTGSYSVPPPTLTGSVQTDIVYVKEVIGVGEVAIADHRGSQPTQAELERLVSSALVGGLMANKGGIVYFHVGAGKNRLKQLRDILNGGSDIPISAMVPTHCNRSLELIEESKDWVQLGGYIDFTASSSASSAALLTMMEDDLDLTHVCMSSDAYGSMPVFDANKKLIGLTAGKPKALHRHLCKMYFDHKWSLDDALLSMTVAPAKALQLKKKGKIEVGADGDVVLLDSQTLGVRYVLARGQLMRTPEKTKKSLFE